MKRKPLPRDAHARGEPRVREDRKLRGRPPAGGRLHARLTDEPGRGQLRQVLIDRRQAEAQGRGDLLLGAGDARLVQIPVDAAARLLAAGADGLVEGRDLLPCRSPPKFLRFYLYFIRTFTKVKT